MTPDYPELAAIRLGYGLSPLMPPPVDLGAVLSSLAPATRPDGFTVRQAFDTHIALKEAREQFDAKQMPEEEYRALVKSVDDKRLEILRTRVARAVSAPSGFGERLVQFWADHFTVVPQNPIQQVMAGAFVDEAIRPHIAGRFGDMLVASSTHPMMVQYLNQNTSYGPNSLFVKKRGDPKLGLNENLGRELLELHTLGVGAPYTQTDVRQLAELLTGLTFNMKHPEIFRPQIAEPGAETILGNSYGGAGTDGLGEIERALHDLATNPATAQHLARKLAVHFASDDPPADLVEDIAATWRYSGGDLAQVSAVLAGHPDLATTFRAKARQPLDYLAAALRSLGVTGQQILDLDRQFTNGLLLQPLRMMGQPFQQARGPDGWPEAALDWITPQTLSTRISWALRTPGRLVEPLPDPRVFLATALGATASDALAAAVPRAETAREGVAIVLASTDFNRR